MLSAGALGSCGESSNPVSSDLDTLPPDQISIFRSAWSPASPPATGLLTNSDRGRLTWYNPFDRVRRTDIWPDEETSGPNSRVDILILELQSDAPFQTWSGAMTALPEGGLDLSRASFLEMWVHGSVGELHIDLGTIDEDVNGDGLLDTEDRPLPGRSAGDGLLSPDEDIGIDGRDDRGELDYYLDLAGVDTTGLSRDEREIAFGMVPGYGDRDPKDPEGDNWDFDSHNRDDYSHINGTEGNLASEQWPDTEDLNDDGILNRDNHYFHYVIDLAGDEHVPGSISPAGWRLFQLPLYDGPVTRVGSPGPLQIESARLLLVGAGPEDPLVVGIARISVPEAEILPGPQ